MQKSMFLCIDLKSFYASVECVERGLDPMTTNLVVADPERSKNTICLAITPAMKKLGIRNRCRVNEIPANVEYITAQPRMQFYIDYAAEIYGIYLKYISKDDIHVYSIREIHKFLRSAFNQAVKWELMARNPVLNASLPKEHKGTRDIWTAETLLHALEVCEDEILSLAINLSFACSLRIGEMLGLTWDCVTIDDESIRENNAQIFVNKELQRVDTETMHKLDNKEIIYVFPAIYNKGTTTLVLKTPKNIMSTRKIYLPLTVANMLKERKKQIEEAKKIYGDEYDDHNLVFCHPTGKPMEGQVINRALQKLIADHNLPKVVFHSFRHASITYKLKWNGGDMKSVQGDSGHSRMDMVAEVYSHIIDEDRRFNAQKFEEQFYQTKGLRNVEEGQTVPMPSFSSATELKKNETSETEELVAKLLNNPEALSLLKAIANKL